MARTVQIEASVRAAAMVFFFGLLAARGKFIDIRSWSPVSWESVNVGESHAVFFRAVGTGGTVHAGSFYVLVKVCSPAEAGGLFDATKVFSS